MYLIGIVALVLFILVKLLNIHSSPERSKFYYANSRLLEQILSNAPFLNEPFSPPRLWGYCGHIQTALQGVISRLDCHLISGQRIYLKAVDNATVTYDLYHAIKSHARGDITLAICPGICNSSESIYIRRVVYSAQREGFRVAVLNHVGVLANVPVTSPRVFNCGHTHDYKMMLNDLMSRFPHTRFICVGFSMGGNLVTKFLGEKKRSKRIIAGLSLCQGYDAIRGTQLLLMWEGFRRLYLYIMTENFRRIIMRWQKQLFTDRVKLEYGINERQVWEAASLVEIDEVYTRKMLGFDSLDEMYQSMSCATYWHNISVPMVFVNALDDPIVPPPLLDNVRSIAQEKPNFLYIEQKYGGHLGFHEGGIVFSNLFTWLDKAVVDISHALYCVVESEKIKPALSECCHSTDPASCSSNTNEASTPSGDPSDWEDMEDSLSSSPKTKHDLVDLHSSGLLSSSDEDYMSDDMSHPDFGVGAASRSGTKLSVVHRLPRTARCRQTPFLSAKSAHL